MSRLTLKLALVATSTLFAAVAARAQDKTLYIGMNGGDMERSYSKYVFPAFEKIYGAKVVVVPGTSSDILAKVQASKEKPPVSSAKRVMAKASSGTPARPWWTISASASPTAGPIWKPAPQKPKAWMRFGVVVLGPTTG